MKKRNDWKLLTRTFAVLAGLGVLALCVAVGAEEPGVPKWHHAGCVSSRLERAVELERLLAEADAVVYRLADYKEPLVSQRRFIIASIARHALRQKTEKS